ncbi:universal stress protein [Mycobacterium novum]|nr:universal stress protein [Mycobacterium novum]
MASTTAGSGIIVGADGSPASHDAIRWAVHAAKMRNIALTIVHVVPPLPRGPVEFVSAAGRTALHKEWVSQGQRVIADAIGLARAAEPATAGHPLDVRGEVIEGIPVPTLVDLSKAARLLVVGPRGLGMIGETLLGSVSSELVRHAHCPVAIIHGRAPTVAQPNRLPVVVGIDGDATSALATELAFEEASWRGVDLIALHAGTDGSALQLPDADWAALKAGSEAVLAEALAGFQERYPDVAVHRLLVLDRPAKHIIEHSRSAQLVVVGSHGRGGFAGMLLGSVSRAVVHAARTPVIVARAG